MKKSLWIILTERRQWVWVNFEFLLLVWISFPITEQTTKELLCNQPNSELVDREQIYMTWIFDKKKNKGKPVILPLYLKQPSLKK